MRCVYIRVSIFILITILRIFQECEDKYIYDSKVIIGVKWFVLLKALAIILLLVGSIFLMYAFGLFGVDEFIDNNFGEPSAADYNVTEKPLRYYGEQLGIDIGAAIHHYTWKLSTDKDEYNELITNEYNKLSFEYVISMEAVWLSPKEYNFKWADEVAEYARDNNKTLRATHLVWYTTIPDWLEDGNYTGAEVEALIEEYITDIMTHYRTEFPGVVTEWNVANEAVSNDGSTSNLYREGFLVEKLGSDWVRKVFEFARAADPEVTLILNDYDLIGVEEDIGNKVDKTYSVVSMLNDRGLIDAVGFQGHLSLKYDIDWTYSAGVMRRFNDLGLKVFITELDVTINSDKKGLSEEKLAAQADIYVEVFRMCLDADDCGGITTWGSSDKYHYINRGNADWLDQDEDWPLLFDSEFRPKSAYFAVQALLHSRLN